MMGGFYKREVSLMDDKLFPRTALDTPIENPDLSTSVKITVVEQSDEDIVDYVVSDLKRIPKDK